jgi:hypothetical protein
VCWSVYLFIKEKEEDEKDDDEEEEEDDDDEKAINMVKLVSKISFV